MIAKYCMIALLAAVAVAQPMVCNGRSVVVTGNCGSQRSHNVVLTNVETLNVNGRSGSGSGSFSGSGSGRSGEQNVLTRNVVVKGKYPVALTNCGPTPDKQIPVTTTHVKTPVEVKPTVRLPYQIPPQRTVSHTCTCYKTVMRPRVHEQIITVPSVQRYIETTHKPVVENIHYEACPTNCNDNSNTGFVFTRVGGNNNGLNNNGLNNNGLNNNGLRNVQTVRVQEVQNVQVVPQVQTVQVVPQVQSVQTVQTVRVPEVQVMEVPQVQQVQTVRVPEVQTVQVVPEVQTVQVVPQVQSVQTVRVPEVQTVQLPQFQTVSVQGNSGCSSCN